MELSVPSILRSCPNLSELSLSGDMVDIQLILNQSPLFDSLVACLNNLLDMLDKNRSVSYLKSQFLLGS
ncbi:hypothetical protein GQ600_12655 [Phytophthora cactorum]|nr:hypothetical protein GQ600_12655 [Phytophthora cactorum]